MILSTLALLTAMSTASAPPATLKNAAALAGIEFGTAVEPRHLEDPALAALIRQEFSVIEAENSMKFGPIHPGPETYDFSGADKLLEFAQANGQKLRGHTLIWHNQNAQWVTDGSRTPEQLAKAFEDHIRTVTKRYAGKVYAWDVVNEAIADDGKIRSSVWYDKPGIGLAGKGTAYIEKAFRIARESDPKAKLYYNDYGAETLGTKADAIYAMLKDFVDRGVPIDGIGFQAHLIMQMNTPGALESIEKNFARFAKLGLDIEITELDIRLPNGNPETLREQAEFYGKFVEVCRRQPKVKLIQTWGVSDKHSWIPRAFRGMGWALLWDEDLKKKPAYDAVVSALQKE